MKTVTIACLSLGLVACGAQPHSPESVSAAVLADDQPEIVCTREKKTGSNRLTKVCRPVANALDAENTRRDIEVLQRQADLLRKPPD